MFPTNIYLCFLCFFFSENCFNLVFSYSCYFQKYAYLVSFPFSVFLLVNLELLLLVDFMRVIGDSQVVCALCWLYFLMLAILQQCFGSAVAQHDLLVLLVLCVRICHRVSDGGRGRTGFEGCKRLRVWLLGDRFPSTGRPSFSCCGGDATQGASEEEA